VLATATGARNNHWLLASASALLKRADEILQANAKDLAGAHDLSVTQLDRLRLTSARLEAARRRCGGWPTYSHTRYSRPTNGPVTPGKGGVTPKGWKADGVTT
jgi:hypothetical protein